MRPEKPWMIIAMMVVLAGTAWMLSRVVGMRFESGAVYAPYSTLRADPLGTKALYESMGRLPGVEVRRNFRRLDRLQGRVGETLVLLNLKPSTWMDGLTIEGKTLQRYAMAGGRVVMTLDGAGIGMAKISEDARRQRLEREKARHRKLRQGKEKDSNRKGDGDDLSEEEWRKLGLDPPDSLAKVSGLDVAEGRFVLTARGGNRLQKEGGWLLDDSELPLWYSGTSLEVADGSKDEWTILATLEGKPVIVERRLGRGSMVVCTDSYFASNEALMKEAAPEFLLWLTGGEKMLVFEETHLGTSETPGIMTLARRFRLHGFFVGGLLLFGLFIWQASSSLIPQRESERADEAVSGQGATAGLVSLLRRGISRKQLLSKCFEAWEKGVVVKSKSPEMQCRTEEARVLLVQYSRERLSRGSLATWYARLGEVLKSRAG